MEDTDMAQGNPLPDEVDVDLDVLGAPVINGFDHCWPKQSLKHHWVELTQLDKIFMSGTVHDGGYL